MRYYEKVYASANSGLHRSDTEEFLAKEAREKLIHLGSGERLLDFGCGTAQLTVHYARAFREVIAVDGSSQMLHRARERAAHVGASNITFLHGDDRSLWARLAGQRFDVVTTAGVLQYLSAAEIGALTAHATAHLSDRGLIVHFDVPDPRLCWLLRLRLLGPQRWRLRQLPSALAATARHLGRRIAAIGRDRPTDDLGYLHHPAVLCAAAASSGLEPEFVASIYYEYRYHCLQRRAASPDD